MPRYVPAVASSPYPALDRRTNIVDDALDIDLTFHGFKNNGACFPHLGEHRSQTPKPCRKTSPVWVEYDGLVSDDLFRLISRMTENWRLRLAPFGFFARPSA
jgi:hypothetical protein